MTEGLAVLDPSGVVQYFNHAAEEHWSMTARAVIGKRFLDATGRRKRRVRINAPLAC